MPSAGQTRLPLQGADGEGVAGQPCLPERGKSPDTDISLHLLYAYVVKC